MTTEDLTEGFIVASNLPGCLPDSDSEPDTFSSWGEARDRLRDNVQDVYDALREGYDISTEADARCLEALSDIEKLTQGDEYSVTLHDNYNYYLERML